MRQPNKDETVYARITTAERDQIEAYVGRQYATVSHFVRVAALKLLEEENAKNPPCVRAHGGSEIS